MTQYVQCSHAWLLFPQRHSAGTHSHGNQAAAILFVLQRRKTCETAIRERWVHSRKWCNDSRVKIPKHHLKTHWLVSSSDHEPSRVTAAETWGHKGEEESRYRHYNPNQLRPGPRPDLWPHWDPASSVTGSHHNPKIHSLKEPNIQGAVKVFKRYKDSRYRKQWRRTNHIIRCVLLH